MAVIFVEGFDVHTRNGATVPGEADEGVYFETNLLNSFFYEPGYAFGQAARKGPVVALPISVGSGTDHNTIISTTGMVRYYCVVKGMGGDGGQPCALFYVDYPGGKFGIQGNGSGNQVRIANGGYYQQLLHADKTISAHSPWISAPDNVFKIDFFVDMVNGSYQITINGVLYTGTFPFATNGDHPSLLINSPEFGDWLIDHIVVTDGEALMGPDVHAYAIQACGERANSVFRGVQPNIVMGGKSYRLPGEYFLVSASGGAVLSDIRYNSGNVLTFVYPHNPQTGEPWLNTDTMEAWGICAWNFPDQPDGGVINVYSVALLKVIGDSSGHPLVQPIHPGAAIYINGRWVPSHPRFARSAHLSDFPRPPSKEQEKWLMTDRPGCILFGGPTGVPVRTDIGITFAEEYRSDFTDWVIPGASFDYSSWFITGYGLLGEGNKKFQSNYVTVNYETLSNGGAYFQTVWDYAMDPNTGRWSTKQQIYRPLTDNNYSHKMTKLKARGHGRSLQVKVSSETKKDFVINGWSIAASSNGA